MDLILSFVSALLPVGLLAYYIYKKDDEQPEPKKMLWKGVLFGVISAVIALARSLLVEPITYLVEGLEGNVLGAICTALVDAAIPEEAVKLLMLWLLIRKNPHFDEKLDGIVYATMVGLGFAGLENIIYVVGSFDDFALVAIGRALFAVPGHFFFAVAMGYYVSLAYFKSNTKAEKRKYWLLAFFVPMVLHWIYDSILMSMEEIGLLGGMLIIAFLAFCIWLRKKGVRTINELKVKAPASAPASAPVTYIPKPLDTSKIQLSEELNELAESISENVHEVWAAGRLADGWTFGPERNDKKKTHPCMVPYKELPESEREYGRNTSRETLKMVLSLGFNIEKKDNC